VMLANVVMLGNKVIQGLLVLKGRRSSSFAS